MAIYRAYDESGPADAAGDSSPYSMGLEFEVTSSAWLSEIRWWQASGNAPSGATRQGALYSVQSPSSGTSVLAFQDFPATVNGWNTITLDPPFSLSVGQRYRAIVFHPAGRYSADSLYYSTGPGGVNLNNGPLRVHSDANATGGNQNSYLQSGSPGFPTDSFNSAKYWIDVAVTDTAPGGVTFDISLSGSVTSSDASVKDAGKNVSGYPGTLGSDIASVGKALSRVVNSAGSLKKALQRILFGSGSSSGIFSGAVLEPGEGLWNPSLLQGPNPVPFSIIYGPVADSLSSTVGP